MRVTTHHLACIASGNTYKMAAVVDWREYIL